MQISLVKGNRKGWIDALRGIAMFLVVFGHSITPPPGYFLFTSPLRMPLFFALSGFLLKDSKTLREFALTIFRGILIPWLILGSVRLLILLPVRGWNSLLPGFIKLLTGEDLWFMPCFIIAVMIHFLLRKWLKKTVWMGLAAFISFFAGYFLHRWGILNYATFHQALTVQPFFFIGFLYRKQEKFFQKLSWIYIALGALLYTGLHIMATRIFPSTVIDVQLIKYYNIPLCLFLSFLGVLVMFTAAEKSDFHSKILSFIGQNTLVIYIWSGGAITILTILMAKLGWDMPVNGWTALLKAVVACFICGLCSVILEHFLPWTVGKRKPRPTAVNTSPN